MSRELFTRRTRIKAKSPEEFERWRRLAARGKKKLLPYQTPPKEPRVNIRVEIQALESVASGLLARGASGEFTLEEIERIGRYLLGRVALIERHVATIEAVNFYNEIEADLAALPVTYEPG